MLGANNMEIDSKKLIIKLPEKPATPYRKLSDGFIMYYNLTDCEVVKFKAPTRARYRPIPITTHRGRNAGRRGSEILSAMPFQFL
jgi:hypothetical protein